MLSLRTFLILGCALLVAGCRPNPRERAEGALRKGGAEQLREDAARLYKDTFSGRGKPDFVEVWYKQWPPSFQKLRPLHVGAYLDGVSIALRAHEGGESGLYIVPKSMDVEPASKNGAKFERLADGVFWYSFAAMRNAPSSPPP